MHVSVSIDQAFDVSVFQGSAVSLEQHPLGYPAGERHDLILFLRQDNGDAADPLAVEQLMRRAGWRKSVLSLILVLTDRPSPAVGDDALAGSYRHAVEHGSALIVCGEVG